MRSRHLRVAGFAAALVLVPALATATDEAAIGRALFRRAWVPAPSSTRAADGLGPQFDARACAACHPGGDRPSLRRDPSGAMPRGMVVRLERPDGAPDPIHGEQMQAEAVPGLAPEARLRLRAEFFDGRRRLSVELRDPTDGPLAPDTIPSLRLAPALHGAGAIEAVPEAAIRALADPEDRDGDGIAGRVSEVRGRDGRPRLGRWGFRATGLDLVDQTATAFAVDMGLSSARRPDPFGDCTPAQTACRSAPIGAPDTAATHEIDEPILTLIAAHLAGLERPERPMPRPPAAPRGARLWVDLGCPACHAPLVGVGRIVHSDLLLHDMGAGLAAGDPTRRAGREWRTTPLLGLGDRLAARAPLLHDGRARTLAEAVAWHGGEAAAAADRFRALVPADRRALEAHLSTFR